MCPKVRVLSLCISVPFPQKLLLAQGVGMHFFCRDTSSNMSYMDIGTYGLEGTLRTTNKQLRWIDFMKILPPRRVTSKKEKIF